MGHFWCGGGDGSLCGGGGVVMRIRGYVALFDVLDRGGDAIERGAFSNTLARRSDPLPVLWQHRPDRRIGTVSKVFEDERGLWVEADIDRSVASIVEGRTRGLSFGYRARRCGRQDGVRKLFEIDLLEVSVVTHPMNPEALLTLVEASPA